MIRISYHHVLDRRMVSTRLLYRWCYNLCKKEKHVKLWVLPRNFIHNIHIMKVKNGEDIRMQWRWNAVYVFVELITIVFCDCQITKWSEKWQKHINNNNSKVKIFVESSDKVPLAVNLGSARHLSLHDWYSGRHVLDTRKNMTCHRPIFLH